MKSLALKVVLKWQHVQQSNELIIITLHGSRRKCEELIRLCERKMQQSKNWRQIQ